MRQLFLGETPCRTGVALIDNMAAQRAATPHSHAVLLDESAFVSVF